MKQVGIIGWRGMVGSVLLERMREERDFDLIEPRFFSTSQAGAAAPDIGRAGMQRCRRRQGCQRHRGARETADADQRPRRRLHAGGAFALAGRGMAGLLDRRGIDPAHGKDRDHRARSGEFAGHAGGARAGRQGLHRRQLHGLADAHGGGRIAARGAGRVDHRDDLPVRLGGRRAAHARAHRTNGRAASFGGAAACRPRGDDSRNRSRGRARASDRATSRDAFRRAACRRV